MSRDLFSLTVFTGTNVFTVSIDWGLGPITVAVGIGLGTGTSIGVLSALAGGFTTVE